MEHHGDDVCGGSCVDARQNSRAIPTVEKLRGESFSFPPEPLLVKLLMPRHHFLSIFQCVLFCALRTSQRMGWHHGTRPRAPSMGPWGSFLFLPEPLLVMLLMPRHHFLSIFQCVLFCALRTSQLMGWHHGTRPRAPSMGPWGSFLFPPEPLLVMLLMPRHHFLSIFQSVLFCALRTSQLMGWRHGTRPRAPSMGPWDAAAPCVVGAAELPME